MKIAEKGTIVSCPRCFIPLYEFNGSIADCDDLKESLRKIAGVGCQPSIYAGSTVTQTCSNCQLEFNSKDLLWTAFKQIKTKLTGKRATSIELATFK